MDGPRPLSKLLRMALGHSQGLCGWSWAALRASVGGPGLLPGPVGGPGLLSGSLWALLGRSRGLCGWPWVALVACGSWVAPGALGGTRKEGLRTRLGFLLVSNTYMVLKMNGF